MPLCTRSEVYIRLVCPGIGLSQGAADDARRQGAGLRLNTRLVVNLLSKGLWVGLSLTSSRMRLLVSYRPLGRAPTPGSAGAPPAPSSSRSCRAHRLGGVPG